MEYRRLGKTGLMVSAVGLGGHWKRISAIVGKDAPKVAFTGNELVNLDNPLFAKNRYDVVTRCLEAGINYVDACSGPEVVAYSKALRGRRDKMYFGYSWGMKESRWPEWRSSQRLLQSLDEGLKAGGLEYVDLWRISLPMDQVRTLAEVTAVEEGAIQALEKAKKQGKSRFTGVSSHNRVWLKSIIEEYPDQIEVVLFPYTADSKQLPDDSIFDAIKQHDVGVFGIKPFASHALFSGDGSPTHPQAAEDDRRARLAIRYVLSNPAITAPIPGLTSTQQVDNMALAIEERRKLDRKEKADLEQAGQEMWARLPEGYQWLKNWEYV
jgi:aryl-alcohol dehydrogenase-like predicted oxidoreductase